MRKIWMAGAAAMLLLAQHGKTLGAQAQIPDAPKPQTIPLGPVAPGKGTTPTSNDLPGRSVPAVTVPSRLPDSPAASLEGATVQDPDVLLPAPGTGAQAVYTLTLRANFVEVPFTVKDSKNRLVPAIEARDVQVYENGYRMQKSVFTSDPFPLSVALVLDQSMPFDAVTRVSNALGALPAAFAAYDEVAVFTYNNGPKKLSDFTAGPSARLTAVLEIAKEAKGREPMYYAAGEGLGGGININSGADSHTNPLVSQGPGSPTGVSQQQVPREVHALNDAILEAAKSLTKVNANRRRIIYVISDGKEYGSVAKTKDVIKFLQGNKIQVFATLTGDSSVEGLGFLDRFHLPLMMRDNNLKAYTDATGGQVYADYRTKAIENSFAQITGQVRNQYTVGYYSREPFVDGKYRKLEVIVQRPNLQVIAKDGYYPGAAAVAPRPATPTPATP